MLPASTWVSRARVPISASTECVGGEWAPFGGKMFWLIIVSFNGKKPRSATQLERLRK